MMDIEQAVRDVAQQLQNVSWNWSKQEVLQTLAPLKPEPESEVPGRLSFIIMDSMLLSVYYESETVERVEITIEVFDDSEQLTPLEYDDKVDEFYEKFNAAASGAQAVMGQPAFNDGAGNPDFPEDEDAVWLALWPLPTARFMILQQHEDKELPFRLSLVYAPQNK